MKKKAMLYFRSNSHSPDQEVEFLEYDLMGSFVRFNIVENGKEKTLIYPGDSLRGVKIFEEETEEQPLAGYREPNSFREQPGTSPHIPGGKLP